jgi:PAS domain S-box-containing protein
MKKERKINCKSLRQQAEERLKRKSTQTSPLLSENETFKLIHELEVHQIELEMQNEELGRTRSAAEEAVGKYTTLYDFAPSGYFTLSNSGEIIELNLSGANMLGKDRSYLKNTRFGNFISRESKSTFNIFLSEIFRGCVKKSCELSMSIEGSLPVSVHLTGIANESGQKCFLNMVDITERKKAEEDLQISENKYRSLVENAIIGIYVTNLNGNFLFANNAMYKMFEFDTLAEFLNTEVISTYKNMADREKFSETIRRDKKVFNYELDLLTKAGKTLHVIINAFISGEAITGMMMDITKRKLAEKELTKKLEDLQRFHRLTVRREFAMIELKREVNELLKKCGQEEKYRKIE